uniref:Uncharacterized protein n=1 Tax=Panagrolaimus sp. JU765 TaxID=591449 RepID=A0AC34R4Q1_9BILA
MTTLTCFSFSRHPLFYGLLAIIFSLYVLCIILVYLTFLICALDKICRRQANGEIAKMGYKDFTDKSWFDHLCIYAALIPIHFVIAIFVWFGCKQLLDRY